MDFDFILNKNSLAYLIAFSPEKIRYRVKSNTPLMNSLWEKYNLAYRFLDRFAFMHVEELMINNDFDAALAKIKTDIPLLLGDLKDSDAFKTSYELAQNYKITLEKNWDENKERINDFISNLLRIPFAIETIPVYVADPRYHVGYNFGNNKYIVFGIKDEWPNYALVYLVHEFLHSQFESTNLEHAIIELIADNELRMYLNDSNEYFNEQGKIVSHPELRELEQKILADWQIYKNDSAQNINQFVDSMRSKYGDN